MFKIEPWRCTFPKGATNERTGQNWWAPQREARQDKDYELAIYKAILFRQTGWEEVWQSTPEELLNQRLFKVKGSGGSHENDWAVSGAPAL